MNLTMTVCGRSELDQVVADFRATHLVVVTDPDEDEDIATRLADGRPCYVMPLWDDLQSADDPDAPTKQDLDALIAWTDALPVDARVIVTCPLGLSRSPAIAYGLLRQHRTATQAREAVAAIRPQASPSPALIGLWERFYAVAE